MKRCSACGVSKADGDFGRNRAMPDGLSFYCRSCNRVRANRYYRDRRRAEGREVRDLSWVPEGYRWCPACRQAVALVDYARNSRTASGYGSRCKDCANEANSAGYFYRTYGLTRRDVEALRLAQRNLCAVCGAPDPEHLDHDHATGRVRQLLCQKCNNGLGLFGDDPAVLRAAAEYVERHRDQQRRERPQPLARRRPEVTVRAGSPPVGSQRRPQATRRTGLCSRGRALLAAREAGA